MQFQQMKIFRFLICFLRAPYILVFLRGQIRRVGNFSADSSGNPVPWLTYPIIDYLDNIDFSVCRVFEYGSGASTLWWAKKAREVTSVEMDKEWYEQVVQDLPNNAEVFYCDDACQYPKKINEFEPLFDVVVIDGAERFQCALNAISKLSQSGIIILDNSDWYPNTSRTLRQYGFAQIDFYGFAPLNSFPSKSSIFCKSLQLIQNRCQQDKPVIGGNVIKGGVIDDG